MGFAVAYLRFKGLIIYAEKIGEYAYVAFPARVDASELQEESICRSRSFKSVRRIRNPIR